MPKIPETLSQYGQLLQTLEAFNKTLTNEDCTINSAEGGVSVVFGSPDFMRRLPEARELHLDGTFKVRPTVPPSRQMLTIMYMNLSHMFKWKIQGEREHLMSPMDVWVVNVFEEVVVHDHDDDVVAVNRWLSKCKNYMQAQVCKIIGRRRFAWRSIRYILVRRKIL